MSLSYAATVTGEVYDLRTGDVLPGVDIALGDARAQSANDGIYRLYEVEPGRYTLTLRKAGYALYYDDGFTVGPGDETWANIGMLPLEPDSPDVEGDFLDLLTARAPYMFTDVPIKRELYELPLRVAFERRGGFISDDHIRDLLEVQNKKLGGGFYKLAGPEEPWDVKVVSVDPAEAEPILVEGLNGEWQAVEAGRATFFRVHPGPAGFGSTAVLHGTELREVYRLLPAFLRRVLIAGRGAGPAEVLSAELAYDMKVATDLDAVAKLIYEAGPAGRLGVYRRSPAWRAAVLADFSLAWGDSVRLGALNPKGEELQFPTEYTLGFFSAGGGLSYGGFRATAGFLAVGIWTEDMGANEIPEEYIVLADRRRLRSYYGRGAYRWAAVDEKVSVTPYAGYRYMRLEGYFRGQLPGTVSRETVVSGGRRLSGPECGAKAEWITGLGDLAFYVDWAEFFGGGGSPVHVAEGGIGAARWQGVGIYVFWRQFWNGTLDWRSGGIALAGEFGF